MYNWFLLYSKVNSNTHSHMCVCVCVCVCIHIHFFRESIRIQVIAKY